MLKNLKMFYLNTTFDQIITVYELCFKLFFIYDFFVITVTLSHIPGMQKQERFLTLLLELRCL